MRLASPTSPTLTATRVLRGHEASRADTLRHLSSGVRVTAGRDDPAGLIASELLRQDHTKNAAVSDNAVRARNAARIASQTLTNVNTMLLEARRLIAASAGSTRSSAERAANQAQLDRLIGDIDRELQGAEYLGRPIFRAPPEAPVPPFSFDRGGDVGAVAAAGSHTQFGGDYSVTGSGRDIWGSADEFYYLRSDVVGDGQLTARIDDITNTHQWAKAALVWRENDTDPGARAAYIIRRPDGRIGLQYRLNPGANSGWNAGDAFNPGDVPGYVRLTRAGNTFTAAYSPDNLTFTDFSSVTVNMSPTATLGIGVTSHDDGTLATATFGDVDLDNVAVNVVPDPYPDPDVPLLPGDPATQAQTSRVFNLGPDVRNGRASLRIDKTGLLELGSPSHSLHDLRSGGELDLTRGDGYVKAGNTVEGAMKSVADLRARVARFERYIVDPADRQSGVATTRLADAASRVRDTDVARATADLARHDLLRASTADVLRLSAEQQRRALTLLTG